MELSWEPLLSMDKALASIPSTEQKSGMVVHTYNIQTRWMKAESDYS